MREPDPDGVPALPLGRRLAAHRFTNAQLLAVDVVTVAVITVVAQLAMSRQAPGVSGTTWEIAGWAGYLVAAGATLWRRRLPRTTLAVVLPIAVAALYSLVAVSSRRTALIAAGLSASTVLAATLVGGGQMVVPASIGGIALTALAWVAGENTRASRVYAAQQAERTAEKAAAATAERARRSGGPWPTSERRSPASSTTSSPTP